MGATTAGLSRRSCGGAEPAFRGVTCPMRSGPGRRCSIASIAGRGVASGRGCSRNFGQMPTTSGIASTARSTGPINTRLVVKGGRCGRDRSLAWRTHDQGTSDRRRARSAADIRDHRRPASRHRTGQGIGRSRLVALPARRQGLRRARLPSLARRAWLHASDPVQSQPFRQTALRQGAVQGTFGDRVHVQLAPASAALCYAIRENTSQLRLRRRDRMRSALASNLTLVFAGLREPDQHGDDSYDHLLALAV